MNRTTRRWLTAALIVFLALASSAGVGLYFVLRSGVTRPFDNMFGDQHLKTLVALIELHKTRYGVYPKSLEDLRFTGAWDGIALGSASYCVSDDSRSYYVEVKRGWVAKPDLVLPAEFWQGTGFNASLGPCD
jgi:hypothetical protein